MPPTTNFEFGGIVLVEFPFGSLEKTLVLKTIGRLEPSDRIALESMLRCILSAT